MGGEGKGACFENCPKSGGEWNSCGVTSAWARIWAICRVTLTADPPAFVRNGSFGTLNSYNSILSLSSPENVFQPRTETRRRFFFSPFFSREIRILRSTILLPPPPCYDRKLGEEGGGARVRSEKEFETSGRDGFQRQFPSVHLGRFFFGRGRKGRKIGEGAAKG